VALCPLAGLDAEGAFRVWRRDRKKHKSPNSAQTEAAMAGALGVQLAGDAWYFGELHHKPTLGANWSAYDQCGYFSAADNYNLESRKKMYSTPFLFYANRPLNPGLFPRNAGNELSSYYLLDAAALCTGFQRTPYMELLLDCCAVSPIYNQRLVMEMTPELRESIRAIHCITYDRLTQ